MFSVVKTQRETKEDFNKKDSQLAKINSVGFHKIQGIINGAKTMAKETWNLAINKKDNPTAIEVAIKKIETNFNKKDIAASIPNEKGSIGFGALQIETIDFSKFSANMALDEAPLGLDSTKREIT